MELKSVVMGAVAGSVLTLSASTAGVAMAGTTQWSPIIPWQSNVACAQEDSTNCAWNASERGNGVGHSFIVVHIKGVGDCVIYDQKRYSRRHNFCTK